MANTIYEVKHNIKKPQKPPYEFIYKLSYISEAFTNKVKSIIRKSNIRLPTFVTISPIYKILVSAWDS